MCSIPLELDTQSLTRATCLGLGYITSFSINFPLTFILFQWEWAPWASTSYLLKGQRPVNLFKFLSALFHPMKEKTNMKNLWQLFCSHSCPSPGLAFWLIVLMEVFVSVFVDKFSLVLSHYFFVLMKKETQLLYLSYLNIYIISYHISYIIHIWLKHKEEIKFPIISLTEMTFLISIYRFLTEINFLWMC